MSNPLFESTELADRVPKIAIFIPSFGDGGVEHMLVNLANGLVQRGVSVRFIMNQAEGPYLDRLAEPVLRVELPSQSRHGLMRDLTAYLQRERPAILMSAKVRDDRIALAVKERLQNTRIRFFLQVGTTLSARARHKQRFTQWLHRYAIRRLYRRADGVLANSLGVAEDVVRFAGVAQGRVHYVPNPTVTPDIQKLASAPVEHPWLAPGAPPLVLGIGGLRRQKDFATLIRAFAKLRARRACRLMILGQGRQEERLKALARRLGVADEVALPGFVKNPYAYLGRASLFTLSSLWEGCPNVLIEALAVGTPVVATDCPSGPREILADGRYGRLAPIADAEALAQAMASTLESPPTADFLRQAVSPYTLENSSHMCLRAFGLA